MKSKFLRNNLWKFGLLASALLFLNILIQAKLYKQHPAQDEFNLPERADNESGASNSGKRQDTIAQARIVPTLNLNLRLLGTIIGDPSLAFISDLDSGRYGLYKLNEIITGARIVSINAGRVILDKDGARQALLLKDSSGDIGEDKRFVIASLSPNEMVVSKSGVISQMDKANALLAKVKIRPVPDAFSDKLRGFRIDNVPSGSIIERAGVRSGDIICAVGGQRLESTQDALGIFRDVQNQSNIEVDLLRNNKPVTLRYEIRE